MMKRKINILLLFLLVFALLLTGCKKQDEASEEILLENPDVVVEEEKEEPVIEKPDLKEEEAEVEEEAKVEEAKVEETKSEEAKPQPPKVEDPKPEAPKQEEKPADERKNILKVEGKVNTELSLSLADLQSFTDIGFSGTFYSLNSFGTTDHTDFKGVNLWLLLKNKAGISDSATSVKIIALDGYEVEFSISQVKRSDYIDETNQDIKLPVIIAWQENGVDYSINEGPPYKLVIGQKEPGDVNKPQWVSNIDKIIVE